MYRFFTSSIAFAFLLVLMCAQGSRAQNPVSPFDSMKAQEILHKDSKGEVCLGKVMTLSYSLNSVEVDEQYHPFLLELSDVLKTPMRKGYRILIKGYCDNTAGETSNLQFCWKRVEALKRVLTDRYSLTGDRITARGCGSSAPAALREKEERPDQDRNIEIHVYGDVSEAVRFAEKEEEAR